MWIIGSNHIATGAKYNRTEQANPPADFVVQQQIVGIQPKACLQGKSIQQNRSAVHVSKLQKQKDRYTNRTTVSALMLGAFRP